MPTKKTASKPKMPKKFASVSMRGYACITTSEEAAINSARRDINRRYSEDDVIGIYRLVKVVRRQEAPVQIEEIEA